MPRETAYDINSSFGKNIIAAYCREKDYVNDRNIMRILETIRLRKYRNINSAKNSIFKYQKGIMIIHSFDEENYEESVIDTLLNLVERIGIKNDVFHVGIGDIHRSLEELDLCIRKSLYALDTDVDRKADVMKFEDTGLNRVFMPLRDKYWVEEYGKSTVSISIKIR